MHPNLSHRDHLKNRQDKSAKKRTKGKGISAWFWQCLRVTIRQWQRRKMIAALEAMDERLLRDVGIDRSNIPRVVEDLCRRELRMAPMAPPANADEPHHAAKQKKVPHSLTSLSAQSAFCGAAHPEAKRDVREGVSK